MGKIKERLIIIAEAIEDLLNNGIHANEMDAYMSELLSDKDYELYYNDKDIIAEMLDLDEGSFEKSQDYSKIGESISIFSDKDYIMRPLHEELYSRNNVLNEMEFSTMIYTVGGILATTVGLIAFDNDISNSINTVKMYLKRTFNRSIYDKEMIDRIAEKIANEPEIIEFFKQPIKKQIGMRNIIYNLKDILTNEEMNYVHKITKDIIKSKILNEY